MRMQHCQASFQHCTILSVHLLKLPFEAGASLHYSLREAASHSYQYLTTVSSLHFLKLIVLFGKYLVSASFLAYIYILCLPFEMSKHAD